MKSSPILNYSFWQEYNQMVIATNKEQHVKNKSFTHKGEGKQTTVLWWRTSRTRRDLLEQRITIILCLSSGVTVAASRMRALYLVPAPPAGRVTLGGGRLSICNCPDTYPRPKECIFIVRHDFCSYQCPTLTSRLNERGAAWTCGIMEIYLCMYFISECKTDKNRYTCKRACVAVTSQQVNLDCPYLQFKGVSRHFQMAEDGATCFPKVPHTHTTVTWEFTSQITSWSHPIRFCDILKHFHLIFKSYVAKLLSYDRKADATTIIDIIHSPERVWGAVTFGSSKEERLVSFHALVSMDNLSKWPFPDPLRA